MQIDNSTITSGASLKVTLSHAVVGLPSKVRMLAHNVNKWWSVKCFYKSHTRVDADQSTHHSYALITITHTQLEASSSLSLFSRSKEFVLPKDCHFWHLSHSLSTASSSMELKCSMNDTLTALFNIQK